jgi:hypothetical protein
MLSPHPLGCNSHFFSNKSISSASQAPIHFKFMFSSANIYLKKLQQG